MTNGATGKEVLDELRVAVAPFVMNTYTQPAFLLKELKEYEPTHQFLNIVANGFLRVGEMRKLPHDVLARLAFKAFFPFVGHFHHPLASDVEDDVFVLFLVAIKEHVADGFNGEGFGQVFQ